MPGAIDPEEWKPVEQVTAQKDQGSAHRDLAQDCRVAQRFVLLKCESERRSDHEHKRRKHEVRQRQAIPTRVQQWRVGFAVTDLHVHDNHQRERETTQHVQRPKPVAHVTHRAAFSHDAPSRRSVVRAMKYLDPLRPDAYLICIDPAT